VKIKIRLAITLNRQEIREGMELILKMRNPKKRKPRKITVSLCCA